MDDFVTGPHITGNTDWYWRQELEQAQARIAELEAALTTIATCAEARIAELQDVPRGAAGRDIAFRNGEILCGALKFIQQYAEEYLLARVRP